MTYNEQRALDAALTRKGRDVKNDPAPREHPTAAGIWWLLYAVAFVTLLYFLLPLIVQYVERSADDAIAAEKWRRVKDCIPGKIGTVQIVEADGVLIVACKGQRI